MQLGDPRGGSTGVPLVEDFDAEPGRRTEALDGSAGSDGSVRSIDLGLTALVECPQHRQARDRPPHPRQKVEQYPFRRIATLAG